MSSSNTESGAAAARRRVPRAIWAVIAVVVVATIAVIVWQQIANAPSAEPTGETTRVTVGVEGMRYVPDVIEVPAGNRLEIEFENSESAVHDLVIENGVRTLRLEPGGTATLDVGVISEDLDGWCSISDHRAQGMELTIVAVP